MTARSSTAARPITAEQREAAREFVEKHVTRIRLAHGFVIVKRYDKPQPAYGIHEVTGLQIATGPRAHRGACLKSSVVGSSTYSGLIADEFAARIRFEQPLSSTLTWRHMSPMLRGLLANASILPHEWKYEDVLKGEFLDDRVRITMSTQILQFLSA